MHARQPAKRRAERGQAPGSHSCEVTFREYLSRASPLRSTAGRRRSTTSRPWAMTSPSAHQRRPACVPPLRKSIHATSPADGTLLRRLALPPRAAQVADEDERLRRRHSRRTAAQHGPKAPRQSHGRPGARETTLPQLGSRVTPRMPKRRQRFLAALLSGLSSAGDQFPQGLPQCAVRAAAGHAALLLVRWRVSSDIVYGEGSDSQAPLTIECHSAQVHGARHGGGLRVRRGAQPDGLGGACSMRLFQRLFLSLTAEDGSR